MDSKLNIQEITNIERKLHPCKIMPEEELVYFPEIVGWKEKLKELYRTEDPYFYKVSTPNKACALSYVRINDLNELYFDIYAYIPETEIYDRFVIRNGYALPPDQEELFMIYCHKTIKIYTGDYSGFLEEVSSYFPEINTACYDHMNDEVGKLFEHIYFASHRSGIREMLYKAKLCNIAYRIDMFEDYSLFAGSPGKLFGMPIRLLRIFDKLIVLGDEFAEYIMNRENRKKTSNIYYRFASYLGDAFPNGFQWRYLCDMYNQNEPFSRVYYNRLLEVTNEYTYNLFEKYRMLAAEFERMGHDIKYPDIEHLYEEAHKLEVIKRYHYGENMETDKAIEDFVEYYDLEYENDTYKVIAPRSTDELLKESFRQHNCVVDYIEDVSYGLCSILFLRRKSDENKSYITLEVRHGEIMQAFGSCNRTLGVEELKLVEDYAYHKYLKYNPYRIFYGLSYGELCDVFDENGDLLIPECEDDERYIKYLEGFAKRYGAIRNRDYRDDQTYTQLTFFH